MRNQRSIWTLGRHLLGLILLVSVLAALHGCTRAFYRKSADREVNDILVEKDQYDFWKIEQYHIYPDPRARYGDPTNPDRPPMPPDDEAAWKTSPHPQQPGHSGVGNVEGTAYLEMIKLWDQQNRAGRDVGEKKNSLKPGDAKQPVQSYFDEPLNAKLEGFLLNLEQAIELGVINSREYQNFREELYLAALPVTQERFSFAYQWAAVADFIRQYAGPKSDAGFQNNWTGNSSIGFSKLFSTGALLTLDFTNTTVWNFASPQNGLTSQSMINLNFMQPLLQGGGKAVTLEPLTQAERNLFYSIRAFARFRKQYDVAVALGSSLPGSLSAATGIGSGTNPISVLAALGIASTDVSGGFVGYLSTLFRECDMAADKKWVQDLEVALKIYEGYEEGGIFSPLQVDQVRSTMIQAKNTVLNDYQFMINALDQFKLVLGLPANLPLILDDAPAQPITRQFDRYYEVIDDSDAANLVVQKLEQAPAQELRASLEQMITTVPLVRGTQFKTRVLPSWEIWQKRKDAELEAELKKLNEDRRDRLNLKTDLLLKKETLSKEQAQELQNWEFEMDVGALEKELRRLELRGWEKLAKKDQAERQRIKLFRIVGEQAKTLLVWARNERFDKVFELWPKMPTAVLGQEIDVMTADVDEAQEKALKAALTNRVDLMNGRAQVVDAWRQLKVTANALLGVFNVQYNLQAQTPPGGSHPLAFSSSATNQQLSFTTALPLNRVAQRNAYRTALINYQTARRSLMALEDNIAVQVRFDVRQLQLFRDNYINQKRVVQSLYKQVEASKELVFGPPDPDQAKGGTANAVAGAALTNQYLTALGQLNGAQTKMYDIWLSILATRMQLYLDLEQMPLDGRGVWTDIQQQQPTLGAPTAEARPPAMLPPVAVTSVIEPSGSPALLGRPVE